MTSKRWKQIEQLYHSSLKSEPSRRGAFLREACAGDEELQREVESLLAFEPRVESFIESPPAEALADAARGLAAEPSAPELTGDIGHYQILSRLGEGGMGVVYKARDKSLGRSVALKVLSAGLVTDPEHRKRLMLEARMASALNHPNIITVHEIASQESIDFIVMEYVAGKTLDQLISNRPLPLKEALTYAIQIVDGLVKAHSVGIIHRDLKPTNVMVTAEGLVKVLDFGLAKLTQTEHADEGTRALRSETEEGMIIGTLSYMSPEQAEGKKVDARSDIFSFGAVLYEMVSGQKAFEGGSKMSTLAAILKQEPKLISQRVPGTPPDLEKIISRCLRKDPGQRFQQMAGIRVALQELREGANTGTLAPKPALRRWLWAGTALMVVAMACATWFFRGGSKKPQAAPEVVPLTSYPGFEVCPSFSPDGNQVVFPWNGEKQDNYDIYIKLIGSPTPVRLTTDPAYDVSPAFSPDGRFIGFIRVSKQRFTFIIIPAIGGPERIVADNLSFGDDLKARWFSWFPDVKWVVMGGLSLISTETGETRSLTRLPPKSMADGYPAVSPDGRTVAFSRFNDYGYKDLYLLDLSEDLKPRGEPRRLTSLKGDSFGAAWTPDGREIVFSNIVWGGRDGSLWRVPASGATEPEQLPLNTGIAFMPAISRSGNRLVYQGWMNDANVWRLPLAGPGVAGGAPVRLIASTRWDGEAQYSPDGKRIAFFSGRTGTAVIWICDADGSNAVDLPTRGISGSPSWSPDGQRIAFVSRVDEISDIYVIRVSGGKPDRLTSDSAQDGSPMWSRDGMWIYFSSNRTGRREVWKVSAEAGKAVQVTRSGGETPCESPDGRSIYYTKGGAPPGLWEMPVSGGGESQVLPSIGDDYCLVSEGIYFVPEPGADGKYCIQFLSFATGKVRTVAPISGSPISDRLSVSPDGRFILHSLEDEVRIDLMLIENFR